MPNVVQHRSSSQVNTTSLALGFVSSNAAGNLLVYFTGAAGEASPAITAATDSNTNTIANATSVNGGNPNGAARADYVASSHSGANTVTAHTNLSLDVHLHIWEISGCVTVTPLRDSGTVGNSATGSVSTVGSTSQSGDAVLGFFYDNPANDALTAGSGYSPSELSADGTGGDAAISEYKSATANGTQTATCGGNGTNGLSQIIVVFIQAAASNVVFEEDRYQPPLQTIPLPPIQALRDAEDVPTLQGQYDEDFWQNQTAPVTGSLYQKLPLLPDLEEIPAGSLTATVDEYFWPPLPPLSNPFGLLYLPDLEELPAATLTATVDEYLWQNPTPPIVGSLYQPLPLGDPEEIPAASLTATVDEYLWANPTVICYQANLWPQQWQQDPSDMGFPAPVFSLDEDFWQNPLQPMITVSLVPNLWFFMEDSNNIMIPPIPPATVGRSARLGFMTPGFR